MHGAGGEPVAAGEPADMEGGDGFLVGHGDEESTAEYRNAMRFSFGVRLDFSYE
ncbi:hypothetical protein SCA03_08150 [Streptomyces cacaoi]|uniref:Uncharacterized protein n=1 Tax=Streptomyces cacaoi TaxID=1898 RepID=A0A4Y3QS82_STRCI|nr:hypothetical protein SCA03_08150 [Streptomyces cacaoi]